MKHETLPGNLRDTVRLWVGRFLFLFREFDGQVMEVPPDGGGRILVAVPALNQSAERQETWIPAAPGNWHYSYLPPAVGDTVKVRLPGGDRNKATYHARHYKKHPIANAPNFVVFEYAPQKAFYYDPENDAFIHILGSSILKQEAGKFTFIGADVEIQENLTVKKTVSVDEDVVAEGTVHGKTDVVWGEDIGGIGHGHDMDDIHDGGPTTHPTGPSKNLA